MKPNDDYKTKEDNPKVKVPPHPSNPHNISFLLSESSKITTKITQSYLNYQ